MTLHEEPGDYGAYKITCARNEALAFLNIQMCVDKNRADWRGVNANIAVARVMQSMMYISQYANAETEQTAEYILMMKEEIIKAASICVHYYAHILASE